jgi:1-phosphofructokinase
MKDEKTKIITVTLNPAVDVTIDISHFALGTVNRVRNERRDPGGKGINVAKVVRAIGHEVTVTGFLGANNGELFREYFLKSGIHNRFIEVTGETRANYKLVDTDDGKVTEINFPGISIAKAAREAFCREMESIADRTSIIVLAGSLPPDSPVDFYCDIIHRLEPIGCRIFLDASGAALAEGIKAQPYLIKPNLEELSELTGKALDIGKGLEQVVDELLASGISQVVVSLGARGALLATREERLLVHPPLVQVGSTVGAGDAFVAGLAVGEARKFNLTHRARLATATAAASVVKPGTQAATLSEIEKLLEQVVVERSSV